MRRILNGTSVLFFINLLFLLISCDRGSSSKTYISGAVSLDDLGLPNVTISAKTGEDASGIDVVSAKDGTYKIINLSTGTYTVTPLCKGYTFSPPSKEVTLTSSGAPDINFSANYNEAELQSVSGNISTEHYPLNNATVTAVSAETEFIYTAETDTEGNFTIGLLTDGNYTVTAKRDGYTFTPIKKQIRITGSNVTGEDFTAELINPEEQIQIILAGDINLGNRMTEVISDPDIGGGDYTYPFKKLVTDDAEGITPFIDISKADITVGNLESMITDKGSDTKSSLSDLGYGVSLVANPEAVAGLVYAGFDIISLANNHAGDYGYEGLTDCMDRLETEGIDVLGAGSNYREAHSPVVKELKNTKIAFLGYANVPMYADITGFSPTSKWIARGPENDTEERPGIAWAHDSRFDHYGNFEDMAEDIANAKTEADIVIVSLHFGWEYDLMPDQGPADNQAQRRCAQAAIDAGASVVFGHHPHVVQWVSGDQNAVEKYNDGYIAYSLGNFVFDISSEHPDAPNGEATRGLMLEVIIENRQIIELNQVNTRYYDDYWQTNILGYTGY